MHSIIYSSTASRPFTPEDLAALTEESRQHNGRTGLTGILLHFPAGALHEECFLQVLEGELDAVEDTYERIRRDPRHHDLRLIDSSAVDTRAFGEWAMALREQAAGDVHEAARRTVPADGMPGVAELLGDPAVAEALLGLYTARH